MAGIVPTNAQSLMSLIKSKISIGVKGEGSYSGFILSDMDNTKSTMSIGGSFGTSIKFNINKNFAIQEDILFTYASSKLTQGEIEDTYQYFGTEIPIYLMVQKETFSGGHFYGGVGPCIGYGFSAKMKDSGLNLYKKADGEISMKRTSFGAAAQLGYEFPFGLQINASYKIGFTNALDSGSNGSRMLPHSASLGIGYRF